MTLEEYVISIRRDARDRAPADWIDLVRRVAGITIRGSAHPDRIQVEASPEAIEELRHSLSSIAHIEKLILHKTL